MEKAQTRTGLILNYSVFNNSALILNMLKYTFEKFLSELKLRKWGSGKQSRQEKFLIGFRVKMSRRTDYRRTVSCLSLSIRMENDTF